MNPLEHTLDREVVIRARRSTVFRFFTDSARFADWWGAGSTIEGRVGGKVRIVMPGNTIALGEVLAIEAPRRVVFTYGFQATGMPILPGGSTVTITLHDHPEGTRLHLHHAFADAGARDHHVQGWRYQLAVFANVAARLEHVDLPAVLDRWCAAWGEPDAAAREAALTACTTDDVTFRDAYSSTMGRGDLLAHLAAIVVHMPGMRLRRAGEPRACQGAALMDWEAVGTDGQPKGRGTNFVALAPDGRIASVVGFWSA